MHTKVSSNHSYKCQIRCCCCWEGSGSLVDLQPVTECTWQCRWSPERATKSTRKFRGEQISCPSTSHGQTVNRSWIYHRRVPEPRKLGQTEKEQPSEFWQYGKASHQYSEPGDTLPSERRFYYPSAPRPAGKTPREVDCCRMVWPHWLTEIGVSLHAAWLQKMYIQRSLSTYLRDCAAPLSKHE